MKQFVSFSTFFMLGNGSFQFGDIVLGLFNFARQFPNDILALQVCPGAQVFPAVAPNTTAPCP